MSKSNLINIDETIKKAAKEAIREFDKEKKDEYRRKVFHNTKLLLSHYNDLKAHINNAIDDINKLKEHELEKSEFIDMGKSTDELYILSIKRSKMKTLIMVAHIDTAMASLKSKQYKLCSGEKYKALELHYIEESTFEQIAEYLNCSVITARRWINEMINELSINLFGIDGMKLDMI
jgi:hypothetical protein